MTADWTQGGDAILYQACADCGARWYFRRGFCPQCGSKQIGDHPASGRGTVYAATLVTRAPTDALRALAPYLVVLVDAAEGFRLMAHGDKDLAIGDAVQTRIVELADRRLPYAARATGD